MRRHSKRFLKKWSLSGLLLLFALAGILVAPYILTGTGGISFQKTVSVSKGAMLYDWTPRSEGCFVTDKNYETLSEMKVGLSSLPLLDCARSYSDGLPSDLQERDYQFVDLEDGTQILVETRFINSLGIGKSSKREEAFEFLCGEQSQASSRNAGLAESAMDNYAKGRIETARNKFNQLQSRGCEGERLPAFLALTYARDQDDESFDASLSDAFTRSNNDLEILWFVGFELEKANQIDFAFSVYEFAVYEIRKSLANGKTREDLDGRMFDEDGGLTEYTSTIEQELVSSAACTAEAIGSERNVEFRRFYKAIFGTEPFCMYTHNESSNTDSGSAGAG